MSLRTPAWFVGALLVASISSPALARNDSSVLTQDNLSALVAARSHFFGPENVDPKSGDVDKEQVSITWLSVQ